MASSGCPLYLARLSFPSSINLLPIYIPSLQPEFPALLRFIPRVTLLPCVLVSPDLMPLLMMFFCLLFLRISSLSSFALLPFPSLFLFSHICISPFFFHLSLSSFILYLSYPFPLPFLSLPLSSLKPIPALSSSLSFSLPLYFHSLTFISFLHSLIIPSCSFLHVFGPPSLLLPFSSSLLSHALTKALTSPFLLLPSLSLSC